MKTRERLEHIKSKLKTLCRYVDEYGIPEVNLQAIYNDMIWLIKQNEEYRMELINLQELNRENLKKIEELESEIDTLSMAHDDDKRTIRKLKNKVKELENLNERNIKTADVIDDRKWRYIEALKKIADKNYIQDYCDRIDCYEYEAMREIAKEALESSK